MYLFASYESFTLCSQLCRDHDFDNRQECWGIEILHLHYNPSSLLNNSLNRIKAQTLPSQNVVPPTRSYYRSTIR